MRFPKILQVTPIKKYQVQVVFDDGVEGIYDLHHLAGKGIFIKWEEDNLFGKVFINKESGAITWPGIGDIDTLRIYCKVRKIEIGDFLRKNTHASYQ